MSEFLHQPEQIPLMIAQEAKGLKVVSELSA